MDDGFYVRRHSSGVAYRVVPEHVDIREGVVTVEGYGSRTPVPEQRRPGTISPRHASFVRNGGGLSILTLNVQFYKVVSTLYSFLENSEQDTYRAFGDLILRHLPDIVCLQEDLYPRPHSLGLEAAYTEVVHCLAERVDELTLANTILVRKSRDLVVTDSGVLALDNGTSTERCASYVSVNGVKIANTHLQGGRLADADYARLVVTKQREVVQIVQELGPDVIVGDFNGSKRAGAGVSLRHHPLYTALPPAEQATFLDYFSGVHDTLADIGYTSAYEEQDVHTTSIFGGVPDWVYVKDTTIGVQGGPRVLAEVLRDQLSDHAGVIVQIKKKSGT
jgi:endonuclease/exonuclease/phosphatase family metal-dependent hydrolase